MVTMTVFATVQPTAAPSPSKHAEGKQVITFETVTTTVYATVDATRTLDTFGEKFPDSTPYVEASEANADEESSSSFLLLD